MLEKLSDDDTMVRDSTMQWPEVIQMVTAPIVRFCRASQIIDYLPYKIRALTTSTPSRGAKETSSITLQQVDGDRWDQVMALVCLNHSIGMKDIHITVDSDWTRGGIKPPEPSQLSATSEPVSTPLRKGKRTERSIQQSREYQEDRGIFWNEVLAFWTCDNPMRCKVKLRLGITCFVYKGKHYEITHSMAAKWRQAIDQEGGSVQQPPRSINKLIRREDARVEAEVEARKAEKRNAKGNTVQTSPSVSQVFYVGSQPSASAHDVTPQPPRKKSASPIPIPPELDNGIGWLAFWDSVKASVRGSRPEAWQAGLDRAMAALDADFWTLAMLFKASTTELEKVVPQTGLRVLIHDHLSKFISLHKENYSAAS
ncbi:hypothetical protein KCU93_g10107, partial [Aureobasidium melanogenum]